MAEELESPASLYLSKKRSFRKTDAFYDWLEHASERTERLLKRSRVYLWMSGLFHSLYELIKLLNTLGKQ